MELEEGTGGDFFPWFWFRLDLLGVQYSGTCRNKVNVRSLPARRMVIEVYLKTQSPLTENLEEKECQMVLSLCNLGTGIEALLRIYFVSKSRQGDRHVALPTRKVGRGDIPRPP